MNKISLIMIGLCLVLMVGFVSASDIQSIQPVTQNSAVNLVQGCKNSTYANITYITAQGVDGFILAPGQYAMTQSTNDFYNYTFNKNSKPGVYQVFGHCDEDGIDTPWAYSYDVGVSNIAFYIIIIVIIYAIAFIGFFGKNEWVAILGGLGMIALGLYTINNGIVIYKDFITNIFSWTTIGVGAFFALYAGVSVIYDNL